MITYVIDQGNVSYNCPVPIIKLNKSTEAVDVVVITTSSDFEKIKSSLNEYYHCPKLILAEIIDGI